MLVLTTDFQNSTLHGMNYAKKNGVGRYHDNVSRRQGVTGTGSANDFSVSAPGLVVCRESLHVVSCSCCFLGLSYSSIHAGRWHDADT